MMKMNFQCGKIVYPRLQWVIEIRVVVLSSREDSFANYSFRTHVAYCRQHIYRQFGFNDPRQS